MSNDGKKMFMMLGGVAGVAVIAIVTTFIIQAILQRNPTPQTTVAAVEQPVVQTPPVAPVQTPPTAQVINVKPHYVSTSVPKRRCRQEQHIVYTRQESQAPGAGAVIGGVTGAIVGSQVGGGDGRIVSSAAGAAIGALTGNAVQKNMNKPQAHPVTSTVCSTEYVKSSVQKGYEVTYTYNGQQGVIIMDNPPMIGSPLPTPMPSTAGL